MNSSDTNWSTDDMRLAAENWTLSEDVKLRQLLMSVGSKLDGSLRQLQDSLADLDHRIDASTIRLGNISNRLGLLSTTQFIEKRVSDEDETAFSQVETISRNDEDSKDTHEEIFCRKAGEALAATSKFVDSAFETVEFENSDSEEDEEVLKNLSPIFESRNVYHLRRLPFIIGTQKFLGEEKVGLESPTEETTDPISGSTESDDSEPEVEVKPEASSQLSDYSVSESEESTNRPEDMDRLRAITRGFFTSGSEDEDEGWFNSKKSTKQSEKVIKSSILGELSIKIGVQERKKNDVKTVASTDNPDANSHSNSESESLINNYSSSDHQKTIANDASVTKEKKGVPETKGRSIFESSSGTENEEKSGHVSSNDPNFQSNGDQNKNTDTPRASTLLFGSDSDSDDLFSNVKAPFGKPVKKEEKVVHPDAKNSLFAEDDDDIGSMFSKPLDINQESVAKDSQMTQSAPKIEKSDATTRIQEEKPPAIKMATKDKDVMVTNKSETVSTREEKDVNLKPGSSQQAKISSIFGGLSSSEDELDALFKTASSKKTTAKKSKSLFSDSTDEDEFFGAKNGVATSKKVTAVSIAEKIPSIMGTGSRNRELERDKTANSNIAETKTGSEQLSSEEKKEAKAKHESTKEESEVVKSTSNAPVAHLGPLQVHNEVAGMKSNSVEIDESPQSDGVVEKKIDFLTKVMKSAESEADSKEEKKLKPIDGSTIAPALSNSDEHKIEGENEKHQTTIEAPTSNESESRQELTSNDDDKPDGNIISARKGANFKDILNAKLAHGPVKTAGKRKESETKSPERKSTLVTQVPKPLPDISNAKESKKSVRFQVSDEAAFDLDPSVSSAPLQSLTRSRPRMPTSRRAPSRSALKASAGGSLDQVESELIISVPIDLNDNFDSDDESESDDEPDSPGWQATVVYQQTETAKFSSSGAASQDVETDDKVESVPETQPNSGNTVPPPASSSTVDKRENVGNSESKMSSSDEDMFGPPPMPEEIKSKHDPLFGSPSSDEDDLFAEKSPRSRLSGVNGRSLFDDDDESEDDLFAKH